MTEQNRKSSPTLNTHQTKDDIQRNRYVMSRSLLQTPEKPAEYKSDAQMFAASQFVLPLTFTCFVFSSVCCEIYCNLNIMLQLFSNVSTRFVLRSLKSKGRKSTVSFDSIKIHLFCFHLLWSFAVKEQNQEINYELNFITYIHSLTFSFQYCAPNKVLGICLYAVWYNKIFPSFSCSPFPEIVKTLAIIKAVIRKFFSNLYSVFRLHISPLVWQQE